jgi:hypothetical protein
MTGNQHRFFRGLTIRAHVVPCELWLLYLDSFIRATRGQVSLRMEECQMTRGLQLCKIVVCCHMYHRYFAL